MTFVEKSNLTKQAFCHLQTTLLTYITSSPVHRFHFLELVKQTIPSRTRICYFEYIHTHTLSLSLDIIFVSMHDTSLMRYFWVGLKYDILVYLLDHHLSVCVHHVLEPATHLYVILILSWPTRMKKRKIKKKEESFTILIKTDQTIRVSSLLHCSLPNVLKIILNHVCTYFRFHVRFHKCWGTVDISSHESWWLKTRLRIEEMMYCEPNQLHSA